MKASSAEPARASTRRSWTREEDQILQREAEIQLQTGTLRDWRLIATKLPNRTNKDCRKRWSKISDGVNKGPWSHHEDKALEEAIAQVGPQWISVAKRVGTRHADQCAKRWRHFLDPELDHSQWEPEDDARLWGAFLKYGSNWRKVIEEEFPERSPTNVKNRYAVIKNLRRRGKSFASPPSQDQAETVGSSASQFSTRANDGGQGPTPSDSSASTADPDTNMLSESAVYLAGAMHDNVDPALHDAQFTTGANDGGRLPSPSDSSASAVDPDIPMLSESAVYPAAAIDDEVGTALRDAPTPHILPSFANTRTFTDARGSNSQLASDLLCTTLAPASSMHMQHCRNPMTSPMEEQMPDGPGYNSLTIENFPQMDSEISQPLGNNAEHELYWETQNTSMWDGWIHSAMEGSIGEDSASTQATSLSSESNKNLGETRRVSLFLEDMQPETANKVTSMLLNSNVDVKLRMTVR